jgi:hypothetical protein
MILLLKSAQDIVKKRKCQLAAQVDWINTDQHDHQTIPAQVIVKSI